MAEPPEIRGELINVIWDTIYQCIFTPTIDPPLTFEEVEVLQSRLRDHIDATKFKLKMMWAMEDNESLNKEDTSGMYK